MTLAVSFTGYLRFLYLWLRGKKVVVTGSCRQCGNCCRGIHLKYEGGWIRTRAQFDELLCSSPEYDRFIPIGPDVRGFQQFDCSWLVDDTTCRHYEMRLDICRRYPSRDLYLIGGAVLPGCGFTFRTVTPFANYLKKEQKRRKG